jgi:mRNA interferase RelE/StbE
MTYRVVLTAEAKQLLAGIQDRREQGVLLTRLEQLAESPEQQGKPLRGDLTGYRSIRAIGQRYRIIDQIVETQVSVDRRFKLAGADKWLKPLGSIVLRHGR